MLKRYIAFLIIFCLPLTGQAVSIQLTKLTGPSEANQVEVTSAKDLQVTDAPNIGGVEKVFSLTTTAQELKVGATPKTNRKYVYMEALTNNVKWGFSSSCLFSLKKSAFFILPMGQATTVYLCASSGTASIVGAEI